MCTTIQLEHSIMIWRIIYYNINDHMKSPKSLIIKLLFFLLDSSNKNYLFVQNLCNNDANIRIIFSLNIFHCLNYKLVGTNKNCVFFFANEWTIISLSKIENTYLQKPWKQSIRKIQNKSLFACDFCQFLTTCLSQLSPISQLKI